MLHAIKYVEQLEKAGFTKDQAQQSVKVWMEFMDNQFATKTDLLELKYELKSEINHLENNIKSEFARVDSEMKAGFAQFDSEMKAGFAQVDLKFVQLENKLILKLGSMMAASIAILATFIVLTK